MLVVAGVDSSSSCSVKSTAPIGSVNNNSSSSIVNVVDEDVGEGVSLTTNDDWLYECECEL